MVFIVDSAEPVVPAEADDVVVADGADHDVVPRGPFNRDDFSFGVEGLDSPGDDLGPTRTPVAADYRRRRQQINVWTV